MPAKMICKVNGTISKIDLVLYISRWTFSNARWWTLSQKSLYRCLLFTPLMVIRLMMWTLCLFLVWHFAMTWSGIFISIRLSREHASDFLLCTTYEDLGVRMRFYSNAILLLFALFSYMASLVFVMRLVVSYVNFFWSKDVFFASLVLTTSDPF